MRRFGIPSSVKVGLGAADAGLLREGCVDGILDWIGVGQRGGGVCVERGAGTGQGRAEGAGHTCRPRL